VRTRYFYLGALACTCFGTNLMAQPSSPLPTAVTIPSGPSPASIQQTITTGMVGFTPNQTARLSVLNLNPVSTTNPPQPNCTAELQFFDPNNNSLKQSVVPNFAPQTATSLDLTAPPQAIASLNPSLTPQRLQIRGAVSVNPAPTVVMNPSVAGYCAVMVTLEIFDNTTGNTVALTTDTRVIGTGGIVPLAVMRGGNWFQSAVPN
jgi:hypothetical protein